MTNVNGNFPKNPLGIIALFITLCEAFATIVLTVPNPELTNAQRWLLLVFVVVFPFVVLRTFKRILKEDYAKFFAPDEFGDNISMFFQKKVSEKEKVEVEKKIEENIKVEQISNDGGVSNSEGGKVINLTDFYLKPDYFRTAPKQLIIDNIISKIEEDFCINYQKDYKFKGICLDGVAVEMSQNRKCFNVIDVVLSSRLDSILTHINRLLFYFKDHKVELNICFLVEDHAEIFEKIYQKYVEDKYPYDIIYIWGYNRKDVEGNLK